MMKLGKRTVRIIDCRGLSSIRGLMFDNMKGYDGALIYGNFIWMPFVRHSLVLYFLDENRKIVDKQLAKPMTLHPRTWKIYSNKKARFCVEVKK